MCREYGVLDKVVFDDELAIHIKNKDSKSESLFYAIRCAFAHGLFNINSKNGEHYYILENRDREKLKARLILREETLLQWIKVVDRLSIKK